MDCGCDEASQCLAPHVQREDLGLRMAQFMADDLVGLCVLMVQAVHVAQACRLSSMNF